jgi:K+-transporting ATPase ATPase B chain
MNSLDLSGTSKTPSLSRSGSWPWNWKRSSPQSQSSQSVYQAAVPRTRSMNTGTQAAKEAGNMVDLDSNPTKLIEVVDVGKLMLVTRGALTTFSVANDIAKYFAIIPAAFATTYPALDALNVMGLASPESAILSAVIFNALIIVVLVPLALRGVKTRATSAAQLLRRNLSIYGLGGIVVPFIGIKLIDVIIAALGLA